MMELIGQAMGASMIKRQDIDMIVLSVNFSPTPGQCPNCSHSPYVRMKWFRKHLQHC